MAATAPPETAKKAKSAAPHEPTPEPAVADEVLTRIRVDLIDVGDNVRKTVGDVTELAASIAQVGVLQPVKVLGPFPDTGRYALVYGQRRLTAVRSLGWSEIKAVVVAPGSLGTDARTERVIEQLLENAQREDLAPLETAAALRVLVDQAGSQVEVARRLGKSEGWVSSTLKLLEIAPEVRTLVAEGKLTASHAEAIASSSKSDQVEFATWAVTNNVCAKGLEGHVAWTRQTREDRRSTEERINNERAAKVRTLVSNLVKRRVTKATTIRIYGYQTGWVKDGLHKAGYPNADTPEGASWRQPKPAGEFCNCDGVWDVEVAYSGDATIHPGCAVPEHRQAAAAAAQAKREQELAGREAERNRRSNELAATMTGLADSILRFSRPLGVFVALLAGDEYMLAEQLPEDDGDLPFEHAWELVSGLSDDRLRDLLAKGLGSSWWWDHLDAAAIQMAIAPAASS